MTDTRSIAVGWLDGHDESQAKEVPALVIAWSAAEPDRVGEVALCDPDASGPGGGPWMLGRGGKQDGDAYTRLSFVRQRPGLTRPMPPIGSPSISRDQLLITATSEGLEVERKGRCPVSISGTNVERGVVRPGETLTLKHQLVLYCTTRPVEMPGLMAYPNSDLHPFGKPDAHGVVGESAAAWELRDQLAFSASADTHVLLLGESGSGKELAAQSIHGLSRRANKTMVSRNAATFPPGIIDAELFGNVKDYPNPGMEARGGVIGEADGSSLFLDEIAELPVELQAHILRVLDGGGEYQRLGDAQMRRADLRLIAATNRDPSELKHDLLARFTLRVGLPGLGDRRDDIPLIVDHLLRLAVKKSPAIGQRFFIQEDGELMHPRIDPDFIEALLRHDLTHHVREVDTLLWKAIGASKGKYVAFSDAVKAAIKIPEAAPQPVDDLSKEVILASLQRHDGKVARAYKELGLKSRYALYRLMKKYEIEG